MSRMSLALVVLLTACGRNETPAPEPYKGPQGDPIEDDCPVLAVSHETVSLTGALLGESLSETVSVTNDCDDGSENLELTMAWQEGWNADLIADFPEQITLGPGQTVSFDLVYVAEGYGGSEATIELGSNGGATSILVTTGTDPDQDGDGHEALEVGGDDCDDQDPARFPQDSEPNQDLVDEDCDGLVDEDFVTVDALRITEFLANPAEVSDAYGEWFEVHNETDADLDLVGWTISGDDGDSHVITSSVIVPAGGQAVIGASADPELNGGAPVDYSYSREEFDLADSSDSIFLRVGDVWVTDLSYGGSGWGLSAGKAVGLDPEFHDTTYAGRSGYWCRATDSFGDGDLGTPGEVNPWCDDVDHDGDGESVDEGDCDDTDPTVYSGNPESWNGLDDNCDGAIDVLDLDDGTTTLTGEPVSYLGFDRGLSAGDLDGDGVTDIVAGGPMLAAPGGPANSYYAGGAYLLDASVWSASSGDAVADHAYATFGPPDYYHYLGVSGPVQGDIDGDGVDDLVLAGSEAYTYAGDPVSAAVLLGDSSLSGDYDTGDAETLIYGSEGTTWERALATHLDLDGDGQAEVIYGDYQADLGTGMVYVLEGSVVASGGTLELADDSTVTWAGSDEGDQLGHAIGGGDVDGDGYPEVLLTAPGYSTGSDDVGAIYLLSGDTSLNKSGDASRLRHLRVAGVDASQGVGHHGTPQLADLDGDGTLDLVYSSTAEDTVYVHYDVGSDSGNTNTNYADLLIEGDGDADYFGHELVTGDFDGDGGADLLVAAPDSQTAYTSWNIDDPGEVYIFSGSTLGTGTIGASDYDVAIFASAYGGFGAAVVTGDFDGDGADELVISEPSDTSKGLIGLYDLN